METGFIESVTKFPFIRIIYIVFFIILCILLLLLFFFVKHNLLEKGNIERMITVVSVVFSSLIEKSTDCRPAAVWVEFVSSCASPCECNLSCLIPAFFMYLSSRFCRSCSLSLLNCVSRANRMYSSNSILIRWKEPGEKSKMSSW